MMAKFAQKVTLSPSRDIPFDKLVLSQSNVRRIEADIFVEEIAEDIARRGLLQSLSVRPVLADDGSETGNFEIPAGGRRFQALSLLMKQECLAKTTPITALFGMPSPRSSSKTTRSLRTCSALPCIRSISYAPSWRCGRRVMATKRSQPLSSSRRRRSKNASNSPPWPLPCSISTPRIR